MTCTKHIFELSCSKSYSYAPPPKMLHVINEIQNQVFRPPYFTLLYLYFTLLKELAKTTHSPDSYSSLFSGFLCFTYFLFIGIFTSSFSESAAEDVLEPEKLLGLFGGLSLLLPTPRFAYEQIKKQ